MENLTVAGPAGCVAPCPDVNEGNLVLWDVFQRVSRRPGAFVFSGMDGNVEGISEEAYRQSAEAAGLPWNDETQDRFAVLEHYWKQELDRIVKRQRERAKQKAKAGHGSGAR